MALNPKQKLFVAYYAKTRNATRAAIKAGYSKETAYTQGPRLLANVQVKAAIDKAILRIASKAELKAADVLNEIKKIAFSNIANAFSKDGLLLNPLDMPKDTQLSVNSFEVMEEFDGVGKDKLHVGYTKKIKMNDKLKALEMLAKHFKLLTDKVEHYLYPLKWSRAKRSREGRNQR